MAKLTSLEEVLLIDERGGNFILEVDVGGRPTALDYTRADAVVGEGMVVTDEGEKEATDLAWWCGRRGKKSVENARGSGVSSERQETFVAE